MTVGGTGLGLVSQATAVSANEAKDFSHSKTNATSGSIGVRPKLLAFPDSRPNRVSSTYLSQMTPSYVPMTGDDLWRGDLMGAGRFGMTQNLKEQPISNEDFNHLLVYRLQEEARMASGDLPDAKHPYLLLHKPSQMQVQQEFYERVRQRMFFSSVNQADNSLAETNKIKRIMFKESMSFKEWSSTLENKRDELARRQR